VSFLVAAEMMMKMKSLMKDWTVPSTEMLVGKTRNQSIEAAADASALSAASSSKSVIAEMMVTLMSV